MKRYLLAAALAALWAQTAQAEVHLSLDVVTPTAGGFDWMYDVFLDAHQGANHKSADVFLPGDFFTVYNIGKFVSASFDTTPGMWNGPSLNWSVIDTDQTVNPNPLTPTGVSLNTIPLKTTGHFYAVTVGLNFGAIPTDYPINATAGNELLGRLHITSLSNQATPAGKVGYWASETATATNYGSAGHPLLPYTIAHNARYLPVPVPEPESLTMMTLGLVAAGAFAFRRRQLLD